MSNFIDETEYSNNTKTEANYDMNKHFNTKEEDINFNKEIKVIHRDGTVTGLDLYKIREVIDWAIGDLNDCKANVLESKAKVHLKNNIRTSEIQAALIQAAKELCEVDPDWRIVAGRLLIWNYYKDVVAERKFGYGDISQTIKYLINQSNYSATIYESYSEEELKEASNWIVESLDEYGLSILDKEYDIAGAVKLTSRYCLPNELPQESYLILSLYLASVEKDYSSTNKNRRLYYVKEFYKAISNKKISLATPLLMNLRKPNGNLASCFIIQMDDTLESIMDKIKDIALISKKGGGVGVHLSNIRASGSWINKRANKSKGVLSWCKLINDVAIAVDQGGTRAGAVTVALDAWHLDILEFLEMQVENGDQRRKSFDLFPQVVIPDLLMERSKSNDDWYLVDPYEVNLKLNINLNNYWGNDFIKAYQIVENAISKGELTLYKKIKAKDLIKSILKTQIETGMPYLFFKDEVNRCNPNKNSGMIYSSNLCVESYSNFNKELAHTCNLVSLNLANINGHSISTETLELLEVEDAKELNRLREEVELHDMCSLAVRILDNSIELTTPPIEGSADHNKAYRTIGVGAMGLADWLANKRLNYKNLDEINNLFEDIAFYCTKASMILAKEREPYPKFKGSEWSKGKLLGSKTIYEVLEKSSKSKLPEEVENNPNLSIEVKSQLSNHLKVKNEARWLLLKEEIIQHGIRNSQITAIAPNTSTSLLQGCTASVLPPFNLEYYDKNGNGHTYISVPLIKERKWYYQSNKYLNQEVVIDAVSTIQFWIDTGISMELLLNLNPGIYWVMEPERSLKAADIYNLIMRAWEKKCKTVYYVRSIQLDRMSENKNSCESCAN